MKEPSVLLRVVSRSSRNETSTTAYGTGRPRVSRTVPASSYWSQVTRTIQPSTYDTLASKLALTRKLKPKNSTEATTSPTAMNNKYRRGPIDPQAAMRNSRRKLPLRIASLSALERNGASTTRSIVSGQKYGWSEP